MMSQEIAQLDAAIETFDHFDQDAVVGEKQRASRRVEDRQALASEYVAKKHALAQASSGSKRAKKGPQKRTALPSTIPQAEAKRYLPPDAHIWRGLVRGEWAGHLRPYPRCSARWADHSEDGALKVVLRMLWRQHFELNGLSEADCPIEGLFPTGPAASQGGSSVPASS
eukprot:9002740-Alexandrium_andersonii.AAC.1